MWRNMTPMIQGTHVLTGTMDRTFCTCHDPGLAPSLVSNMNVKTLRGCVNDRTYN